MPAVIRNRDRAIGRGEPVLTRYERIAFEKELIGVQGKPPGGIRVSGPPAARLPPSTLILERHRDLLKRGAVLVDEKDQSDRMRALAYLEHSIQDARTDRGSRRVYLQTAAIRGDK